jgi:hypothetical protein
MTKEGFLLDPVNRFSEAGDSILTDWIKEASANAPFRDNATYALIRSVRKNGAFFSAQFWLEIVEILTEHRVVDLYLAIRDQSHRYKDEWRGEFEAAFPSVANKLPPPRLGDQSETTNS